MEYKIKKLNAQELNLANELFLLFQEDDEVENPTVASNKYLIKLLSRQDFHVIVAMKDEAVIGGLTAYELRKYKREETEMFLYELGVEEQFQRNGIATALINSLKELCMEKGIDEMFVGALAENFPAIKLYEKTGGEAAKVVEFTYQLD